MAQEPKPKGRFGRLADTLRGKDTSIGSKLGGLIDKTESLSVRFNVIGQIYKYMETLKADKSEYVAVLEDPDSTDAEKKSAESDLKKAIIEERAYLHFMDATLKTLADVWYRSGDGGPGSGRLVAWKRFYFMYRDHEQEYTVMDEVNGEREIWSWRQYCFLLIDAVLVYSYKNLDVLPKTVIILPGFMQARMGFRPDGASMGSYPEGAYTPPPQMPDFSQATESEGEGAK